MAQQGSSKGGQGIMDYQKAQLVTALTQVAIVMRNAAQEAQTMATLMSTLGPNFQPTTATTTAFNNRAQLSQLNLGGLDGILNGGNTGIEGTSKKRGRGGKEKRERRKEAKDPNAPKRPASAYLIYQNDVRKEMLEKFKGMPHHDVLAEIAKMWSTLDPETKNIYLERGAKAKVKYNTEKAAYELSKVDGEVSPVTMIAGTAPLPPDAIAHDVTSPEAEDEEEPSSEEEDEEEEVEESSDEEPAQPAKKVKRTHDPAPPPIASVPSSSDKKGKGKEKEKEKKSKKH
ncbi:hypothetical protein FRC03_009528 [Tulasnella sp. 419]|nr:hypothetical protein FRC03_009528 [Tulasnella sp. 419]